MHAQPDKLDMSNITVSTTAKTTTTDNKNKNNNNKEDDWKTLRLRAATKDRIDAHRELDESFDSVLNWLLDRNEQFNKFVKSNQAIELDSGAI